MGMLQRFENRLEQAVSGAFAKAFRSAVQPVELAAALQREVDNSAQILSRDRRLVPNTFHDRAVRRWTTTGSPPYAQTLTHRADRHAARARRGAALRLRRTGRDRLRPGATTSPPAGSGCAARPPPRSPSAEQRGQRHRASARPARPSRSTAARHAARPRPGWSSAAAPRPTCASTTPASAVGTRRSGSPPAADDRRRSASSTSAPPTAPWSTGSASTRRDARPTARTVRIGNTDRACSSVPGSPTDEAERRCRSCTLMLIRFAYLAILWIFVLGAISVIRSDMFGARVDDRRRATGRREQQQAAAKQAKQPRKAAQARARHAHARSSSSTAPSAGVSVVARRRADPHRPRHRRRDPPRRRLRLHPARAHRSLRGRPGTSRTSARPTAPTSAPTASPRPPPSSSARRSASARRPSS